MELSLIKLRAKSIFFLNYIILFGGSIPQLAVIINFGYVSNILEDNSFAAKPPNTTLCIAPIRAQANIAKTAYGIIGM